MEEKKPAVSRLLVAALVLVVVITGLVYFWLTQKTSNQTASRSSKVNSQVSASSTNANSGTQSSSNASALATTKTDLQSAVNDTNATLGQVDKDIKSINDLSQTSDTAPSF